MYSRHLSNAVSTIKNSYKEIIKVIKKVAGHEIKIQNQLRLLNTSQNRILTSGGRFMDIFK